MKIHQSLFRRLTMLVVFGCLVAARSADAQPPNLSVVVQRDLPYAEGDNPRQRLDLFLPRQPKVEKLPVIAFIHGGAWRAGDKRAGFSRLRSFVESGRYAGVSIGYRLTGEAQWPAQIHDCKAAIRWIRANAAKHSLDAERIAVWGSSAGGHLVAMLGTSGDVKSLEGQVGRYVDYSSRVTCVVDFFGPTNFLTMNKTAAEGATLDHDAPNSPESLLIGGPIQDHPERVAKANPITYVTADDSPFLIAHGTKDRLVSFNQSELLLQALREAEVQATLVTVKGGGHGWRTRGVQPIVERFLEHHLHGRKSKWKDQAVEETKQRRR